MNLDEKEKKRQVLATTVTALKPTSADQLEQSTGLPFLRSTDLYKTPLSQAFNGKDGVLVLLVKDNPNYGHWTLLLHHPEIKTLEFFDSFGDEIPEEMKQYLIEQLPVGYKVVYSKKRLQKKIKETQTCGRWVVFRYAMKGRTLQDFVQHLTGAIPANVRDLVIAQITSF